MLTKEKDFFYCGVKEDVIKKANPLLNQENLKHLYDWITERYKIHLKKDVKKEKPPWTKNPILKKYRFTNVRREQDKETKWLIKNICENRELSYSNKIFSTSSRSLKSWILKPFKPLFKVLLTKPTGTPLLGKGITSLLLTETPNGALPLNLLFTVIPIVLLPLESKTVSALIFLIFINT